MSFNLTPNNSPTLYHSIRTTFTAHLTPYNMISKYIECCNYHTNTKNCTCYFLYHELLLNTKFRYLQKREDCTAEFNKPLCLLDIQTILVVYVFSISLHKPCQQSAHSAQYERIAIYKQYVSHVYFWVKFRELSELLIFY